MAQDTTQDSRSKERTAPDPEDDRKPDSPTELSKPAWGYIFKRSLSEFSKDDCTDLAASLTYFAVLSLFPALLAIVSLLGVFGQGQATTQAITNFLSDYAPPELVTLLEGPINNLTTSTGAGLALFTGLLGALWTASGYTGAFGRAMNRIYEVEEGRPIWKLRPMNILVTLVLVLVVVLIMLMLLISGGIAQWVGDLIGLGTTAVTVWNIAKWPVVVALAIVLIAILYYFTPNVEQPKFRWISMGSIVALIVAALAAAAFTWYVVNFASYNATYGIIGSVIILLLGLWIINNVLLLGAEIDAEVERGRELQGGIKAEETIQLPPRDTRQIDKQEKKEEKLIDRGRKLRLEHEHLDYSSDDSSGNSADSGTSRQGSSSAS
ncbi:YihY/virulence factor BrkB family protein [Kocuria sp. SM24M-10]|uniref:YihY/virulence factor BrkB family protein n=1 Tax=Kocuria sp. SM24M-10 TaxID=1660349 RepID=UPI00064A16DE|nr:YihY/virulence factor BrkB family protein [Kocuria sp. SM24M-10]KLU08732.1 ribonuclease BN [Kocuria sp. SM24M-10]